ncbi:restriction endonuclease subunit S [Chryseobacterium gleum]|uniref:restriction endonuclease subunit S n=1 Tax=Chryseobacterium gleum TaxID=250 RepID=UPI001E633F6F|nr:restriction endonuclease subunit S [Chryseobacterium gleum]MCE4067169.1 restriction endonuclease subunit S [Chryseobacterium gleum]
MQRYEKYKDSGVDWIGEVPEHWDMLSNKYIFKLKKNQVGKKSADYELLSLTLKGIIKRDMENPEGKFPAEFDTYQEVKKGDFVFCLFDVEETPRTVGLSDFDGMITGAYSVFTMIKEADRKYLYYFYLNLDEKKRLKFLYKGLRNTIPKDSFFNFKTAFPKISEQQTIATFLDDKTTKIDHTIAIKQKEIELLKERRQVLIQKAVTKGLNDTVKLKDSGVDWIGEIPEHWEVVKNKTIFKESKKPGEEDLPLLSVSIHSGISDNELSDEENIRGKIKIEDKSNYKLVFKDDIVYNMMRAWQGAIGSVAVKGLVSPAYVVATPSTKVFSKFFEYQYRTPILIEQMNQYSKGITDFRKRLYWEEFKQIFTILPPFEEQISIVNYINKIEIKVSKAISIKQQEIEKLKEYKMVLIDNVVTGKVRVS